MVQPTTATAESSIVLWRRHHQNLPKEKDNFSYKSYLFKQIYLYTKRCGKCPYLSLKNPIPGNQKNDRAQVEVSAVLRSSTVVICFWVHMGNAWTPSSDPPKSE